jgi:hypothetical protein
LSRFQLTLAHHGDARRLSIGSKDDPVTAAIFSEQAGRVLDRRRRVTEQGLEPGRQRSPRQRYHDVPGVPAVLQVLQFREKGPLAALDLLVGMLTRALHGQFLRERVRG